MPPKVKDIAKMLDISPSTVSLVLHNKPGISEATRKRIFDALQEMGCSHMIPKPMGAGSPNLKFVIYKKHGGVVSDTPFFSQLIEGLEIQSRQYGYNLLLAYVSEGPGLNTAQQLEALARTPCEGLIVLATEMASQDLQVFQELDVPLLVLDSCFEELHLDSVVINNTQGAYEATRHLLSAGHRKIGYLHSSFPIHNFQERFDGYSRGLRSWELEEDPRFIWEMDASAEGAYHCMKRLLEEKRALPTAFFADNDLIALGAMKALKEAGIRIPQEVSVVGFDDMPASGLFDPPLTTIQVPKQRLGMLAVERLVNKIQNSTSEFVKIEVGTQLIQRKSVAFLSGNASEETE